MGKHVTSEGSVSLSLVFGFVFSHGADIVIYFFWTIVAFSLISPLVFADSAYRAIRTDTRYRFSENHNIKKMVKRYYFRRMTIFGCLLAIDTALFLYIWLT